MHTGPLIMGITGDEDRMDATTISDTVNTASRLESLTKHYKGKIIISEATLEQIHQPENFHLRNLGRVQLKGKIAPTSIYECFSGDAPCELQKKLETLSLFNEGMDNYLNQSIEKAADAFSQVLLINPEDLTAKYFLDNAIGYLNNGKTQNMTGVVEMKSK